jgi:tellurite resistance protein TerC
MIRAHMVMIQGETGYWIAFLIFVVLLLALDLGVLNRKAHVVSLREAAQMSALWISIALLFGGGVYFLFGPKSAAEYVTAWVLEKSLSVDNLFVFVLIFSFFRVSPQYHHRVLFWGIIGAIIMRAILIVLGATLIQQFSWLLLVFGAFLIYTGIKLARAGEDDEPDIDKNPLLQFVRRIMRITPEYHGDKFVVRLADGLSYATPLVLVLLVVESTDLVFAVDSIPAVIGISRDPFIIFSSNVMAILGLRALYFLLSGAVDRFHYLKPALAVILTFVGVKMIAEQLFHPGESIEGLVTFGSLAFIIVTLAVAIIASFIRERRSAAQADHAARPHGELSQSAK